MISTRKKNRDDEHQLQCLIVKWFDLFFPNILMYAIPNGARTSMWTAKKLKKEGLRKGMTDLVIAEPVAGYCGAYIETKIPDTSPNKDQREKMRQLKDKGYFVAWYRTYQEGKAIIMGYLSGHFRRGIELDKNHSLRARII